MVTHYVYLKGILKKIMIAYNTLTRLEDRPGDLNTIKKEILKINGFFRVFINKINTENIQSSELLKLKSSFENYLNNYSFNNELDTMASLYSNDSGRLKNMRLKILESLKEQKLIDNITYVLEKV